MKLYKKIASLLAVAALAAVLMPVCMAAPGDSIETRLNHAFALRASTEFYEEVVTTSPDGTTQTMTAARSNGNAYIKMDMGEAGQLVYILKDGQGYLVDAASKLAVSEHISVRSETKTLEKLSSDADAMSDAIDTLQDAVNAAKALSTESEKAVAFHDNVLPVMDALRAAADDAETICGEDYWPLPSYSKMLYYV